MIKREISDALYVLLHCSLKDKEYKTQTEQFYCVYGYIRQLESEYDKLKEVIEEVRERVVELKKRFKQEEHQGTAYDDDLEYEDLLQILDKAKENNNGIE